MRTSTIASSCAGLLLLLGVYACGSEAAGASAATEPPAAPTEPTTPSGSAPGSTTPAEPSEPGAIPPSLPQGLLIAYSQFEVEAGSVTARPGPARLELLSRSGGQWHTEVIEDSESNVFHKAMVFQPRGGRPGIVTLGGMAAAVKIWRREGTRWTSQTLWQEDFGGRFSRMRDAEIGDIYGDGPALAVATHDQGVVGVVRMSGDTPRVERLWSRPNTFVHEIEIGDLDGNGIPEIYATPSDPNDLDGGDQRGQVMRFSPRGGDTGTVVADLGNRHAKEIWVGDVDGDGRDELYVAVEGLTRGSGAALEIVEPVEIRRYDHDTPPTGGVVVARIANERLTRFLTVGDIDGDGRREMVAATFRNGLWLLRPGRDPRSEWSVESIDRESSGFEHTALMADLDGDGTDELYVAADEQGELRRYAWVRGRARREVIHRRELPRSMMTWNLMTFPAAMLTQ